MINLQGKEITVKEDLLEVFSATEGSINMYYGMIGHGKTYSATSDILDLLKEGKVVYANWHIIVPDYDDREDLLMSIKNLLFFRKNYYFIPASTNLRYFDPDNFNTTGELVEWLSSLNDCHIFFDEGQDMFDSYEGTRFSKAKRRLILHTRHYHRTLNIISQRPTAIQVSARGNVNRFYKCTKLFHLPILGIPLFCRYEFQEMTGETVNEASDPVSKKYYLGNPKVFNAYNTDYLAQGIEKSQVVNFQAFQLHFFLRLAVFLRNILKPIKDLSQISFEKKLQKKDEIEPLESKNVPF